GFKVQMPLHVLYYSSQGGSEGGEKPVYALSSPRLLVFHRKGAEINIVEEFIGEAGKLYWANAVVEFFIEDEGKVQHNYVQNQARDAVHIKQTCVAQKESSSYELVEALHKCIVMHSSGHCVFDGNVKVNRYAQQTDAGQLSRSLLLAPRATVSVKPNLQIIADDVKCSHGAAISDLEEDQIFYFQARGIDPQTARSTLVFSFGAEVLQQFRNKKLQERVEKTVMEFLQTEGAIASTG
ncbi:hypothetical protein GOP47_0031224, partial [Adiantum capillus-veneris]